MKKMIVVFLLIPYMSFSQDSVLTYQKVLQVDSLSKDQIFDKALLWCSAEFNNSKCAINVQERTSGLIAGKAYYENEYNIPGKKDSVEGEMFNDYYFDWMIEVKDNKLRYTIKDITVNAWGSDIYTYPVTYKENFFIPGAIITSRSRQNLEWQYTKKYFVYNMDKIMMRLNSELAKNNSSF